MKKSIVQTTIRIGNYNTVKESSFENQRPVSNSEVNKITIKDEPKQRSTTQEPLFKKKTPRKPLKVNKKAIIATVIVAVSAVVITGIVLLGIYIGTLGSVQKDGFCMSDYSCLTNMTCKYGKCDCLTNGTWNSSVSRCIYSTKNTTTTTTTTNTTLPVYTAIKMFLGSSYTISSLVAYNTVAFTRVSDVKCSNTTNYCYLTDYSVATFMIFEYNNLSFVKSYNLFECVAMAIYQNNIFVSDRVYSKIYKYDLPTLTWKTTYLNTAVTAWYHFMNWNTYSSLLHACDVNNNNVDTFDINLSKVSSLSVGSCTTAAGLGNNILYVGRTDGKFYVYQNNAFVASYSACPSAAWIHSMTIDSSSGTDYMIVACYADKKLLLYTLNGVTPTYNASISTAGQPIGFTIDPLGRIWVSMDTPHRVDVYSLN